MNHTLTVRNAYGRDFKSKREILEHYNSNKDFQNLGINQGAYVNKKDAKKFKGFFFIHRNCFKFVNEFRLINNCFIHCFN